MTMYHPKVAEIVRKDPRFAYEAYEFIFSALVHTQRTRESAASESPKSAESSRQHVTGPELLEGVRDLAVREFGLMARTVFHRWGIERTQDIGDIVFNLVEANLMSKTSDDNRQDFRDVYDLDDALTRSFRIQWNDAE
jgi:uncharacterized repeat protein (TIGR04138 family)